MTAISSAGNVRKFAFFNTFWPWAALAIVLIAYAVFIAHCYAPAMSEPDDNGYFAQGVMLARYGRTWFAAQSDAQYAGMHWLLSGDKTYVCRYPVGLPFLIAAVDLIAGWEASYLVNPVLSILALVGVFFLARRFVSSAWALLAVVILAMNSMFVHHALAGDSHMAVTCALAWGLYFLVRWAQAPTFWMAFLAAMILSYIPTVRYPDAVMGLGMLAILACHWRHFKSHPSHLLALVVGAAIPLLPLLVHNHFVYGAFWKTGYSLSNESTAFSVAYFIQHAVSYLHNMLGESIGLMFALGLIGMLVMMFSSKDSGRRPVGWMLFLIVIPMLLLYMAYYWAPQNADMSLRFLLPTYVAYLLAGVFFVSSVCVNISGVGRACVGVVILVFQCAWGLGDTMNMAMQLHDQKAPLVQATKFLEQTVPEGSVVIASSQFLAQLDFVQKWKLADTGNINGMGGGPGGGGPGGMNGAGGMAGGLGAIRGQMGANAVNARGQDLNNDAIDAVFATRTTETKLTADDLAVAERMRKRIAARRAGATLPAEEMRAAQAKPTPALAIKPVQDVQQTGPRVNQADGNRPSPMQQDKVLELRSRYTGATADKQEKFLADVQSWAGAEGMVYAMGTESQLQQWEQMGSIKLKNVAEISLTFASRGMGSRRGGMMGGPGMMGGAGGGLNGGQGGPGGMAGPMGGGGPDAAGQGGMMGGPGADVGDRDGGMNDAVGQGFGQAQVGRRARSGQSGGGSKIYIAEVTFVKTDSQAIK